MGGFVETLRTVLRNVVLLTREVKLRAHSGDFGVSDCRKVKYRTFVDACNSSLLLLLSM